MKLIIWLINFYQRFFSPDHSFWAKHRFPNGYCRYFPSCSEYMKLSLRQYGLPRGLAKGLYRLIRCNPFSPGGYDPIINSSQTHG